MSDKTRDALIFVARKSVAALRRDVKNVDKLPAEVVVPRIVEEADALSSALLRLGRYIEAHPPERDDAHSRAPAAKALGPFSELLTRFEEATERGLCPDCGGILPPG